MRPLYSYSCSRAAYTPTSPSCWYDDVVDRQDQEALALALYQAMYNCHLMTGWNSEVALKFKPQYSQECAKTMRNRA